MTSMRIELVGHVPTWPEEVPISLRGHAEAHAPLMIPAPPEQVVHKICGLKNFLRSIDGRYLHFNRVDKFEDFNDGALLPLDRASNESRTFEKAPNFSMPDYYDETRRRTYACCLSMEASDFIWDNYGNGDDEGKVCIIFDLEKLRRLFRDTFDSDRMVLTCDGKHCLQFFSFNLGCIDYVDREALALGVGSPVQYAYLKDKQQFADEKEFRLSFFIPGMGGPGQDGKPMQFPPSLQFEFDFKATIEAGIITGITVDRGMDAAALQAELAKRSISIKTLQRP